MLHGMKKYRNIFFLAFTLFTFGVGTCLCAQADYIWDVSEKGIFDSTNKAYKIEDGCVTVELDDTAALCPTGLGHLASGMDIVKEIQLGFTLEAAGDFWLHLSWNPGGSGQEQFEVFANNVSIKKSELLNAQERPQQEIKETFKVGLQAGANTISLRQLSGDGLNFHNLSLTTTEELPYRHPLKPNLEFPTLQSYEKEIKEPGIILDSTHVRLFAPQRMATAAKVIFPYLVKAYQELYRIVGIDTEYKIVVYHFPEDGSQWVGGTSVCSIKYGYKNLDVKTQTEWKRYHQPHVSGYIEEMAHNFVSATKAQFGWEMIGWTLGVRASEKVANNTIFTKQVQETRKNQQKTYQRYREGGYIFPEDLPENQCDRIHAYILWEYEKRYGPEFWQDFFKEVKKEQEKLHAANGLNGDELRNRRYQITIDCFDRLKGVNFKKTLEKAGISLTTDIKSLHPTDPGWDRKYLPKQEQ